MIYKRTFESRFLDVINFTPLPSVLILTACKFSFPVLASNKLLLHALTVKYILNFVLHFENLVDTVSSSSENLSFMLPVLFCFRASIFRKIIFY